MWHTGIINENISITQIKKILCGDVEENGTDRNIADVADVVLEEMDLGDDGTTNDFQLDYDDNRSLDEIELDTFI